jgi:hypothetical protein
VTRASGWAASAELSAGAAPAAEDAALSISGKIYLIAVGGRLSRDSA